MEVSPSNRDVRGRRIGVDESTRIMSRESAELEMKRCTLTANMIYSIIANYELTQNEFDRI